MQNPSLALLTTCPEYRWFVYDTITNEALTGNEYRADAVDARFDQANPEACKVVSRRTLLALLALHGKL